jgi:hypothetical protein
LCLSDVRTLSFLGSILSCLRIFSLFVLANVLSLGLISSVDHRGLLTVFFAWFSSLVIYLSMSS